MSQSGLTSARPKTLQSVRNIMQTWEQEVAEFKIKDAKKVDKDAETLSLKSIMLETLIGKACVCVCQKNTVKSVCGHVHSHHQQLG